MLFGSNEVRRRRVRVLTSRSPLPIMAAVFLSGWQIVLASPVIPYDFGICRSAEVLWIYTHMRPFYMGGC